jgi:hypothetical protein
MRGHLELGVPEFFGPDIWVRQSGMVRGEYKATIQAGITYRPDPHGKPTHFRKSNPRLVAQGGGGLLSEEGTIMVSFPPFANAAFNMRNRSHNGAVTMRFLGAAHVPVEVIDDRNVAYRDIYTDVDLELHVGPRGWKANWVLKGPGHPANIEFRHTSPQSAKSIRGKALEMDTGDGRYKIGAPFTYGPDQEERFVEVEQRTANIVRWTWPDMSDMAYPVEYDPFFTFEPDASVETSSVDGYAGRTSVDQTYSNIRSGAGNNSLDNGATIHASLRGSTTTDQFQILRRGIMVFDTTLLDFNYVTVTDSDLRVTGNSLIESMGTPDYDIVLATSPSSATAIVNGDYDIGGFTTGTIYASLASASLSGSAEMTFATGSTAVQTAAVTRLGMLMSWDTDNSFGGTWGSSNWNRLYVDSADGTVPPALDVTFTHDLAQGGSGAGDAAGGSTFASSSWTPAANRKSYCGFYFFSSSPSSGDPSVTGNGITWTKMVGQEFGTGHCFYVYEGTAEASPTTGVTTVDPASTDTVGNYTIDIWQPDVYSTEVQQKIASSSAVGTTGHTTTLDAAKDTDNILLQFSYARNTTYGAPLDIILETGQAILGMVEYVNDITMVTSILPEGYVDTAVFTSWNDGTHTFRMGLALLEFAPLIKVSKVVSEAVNMVEGTVKFPNKLKIVAEALNLGEASDYLLTKVRVLSEALNMVEAAAKVFAISKVVSEALNIVEAAVKVPGIFRVKDEALNIVEGTDQWQRFYKVVDEALNMAEGTVKATVALVIRTFYEVLKGTRILTETGLSSTRTFYETLKGTRILK